MSLPITSELQQVLDGLLDSIEKVEIVWYLTHAGGPVLSADLQASVRADEETYRAAVTDLVGARVLELTGTSPPEVGLAPRARQPDFEALMRLYTADRAAVVTVLASMAVTRIRNLAARTFVMRKPERSR